MTPLPEALVQDWRLTAPEPVTRTGIATIWRATRDGLPVAVKQWRPGIAADEQTAVALLRAWGPDLAAPVLATAPGLVLMGWLDGPPLGDLCRSGRDAEASAVLAGLARDLGRAPCPDLAPTLKPLTMQVRALTELSHSATPLGRNLGRAQGLLFGLLATAPPPRALHGDLHHDNVLMTHAGPRVIDPKGIWGDPAYELANAFRNPKGFSPGQITADLTRARAALWAPALGCTEHRLLQWAAVKCALSILWRREDGTDGDATDPDAGLLSLLVSLV